MREGTKKWTLVDGTTVYADSNGLVAEKGGISRVARNLLERVKDEGRLCSVSLSTSEKLAVGALERRNLVVRIPAPDECSPGTVVYYIELPPTVT